jgi:hypothetical protein
MKKFDIESLNEKLGCILMLSSLIDLKCYDTLCQLKE